MKTTGREFKDYTEYICPECGRRFWAKDKPVCPSSKSESAYQRRGHRLVEGK